MKGQRGITLIALVITIIILLILAGVTLSLVVGDNGILGNAKSAVSVTKKSAAEEQVYLAWTSAQTSYFTDRAYDKNVVDADYFRANKLTNYVSQGEIVEVKYKMNEEGDSEVTYKDTSGKMPEYYTVIIKENGKVVTDDNPTTPGVDNIEELDKATKSKRNALDAIGMIQTAEGGLTEMHSRLQRLNELAIQSANDTSTSIDREAIIEEAEQILKEVDGISSDIQYSAVNLLDGTIAGSNGWKAELEERTLVIAIDKIDSNTLGLSSIDVATSSGSMVAIDAIKDAIKSVADVRSKLGARQNQLEHFIGYYEVEEEILSANLSEAEIKDRMALAGATEILSMLDRIDKLTVQASNAIVENYNHEHMLNEALLLKEAIGIFAEDVGYKGQKLLNGTYKDIQNLGFTELYVDFATEADITRTKTEVESAIEKVEANMSKI